MEVLKPFPGAPVNRVTGQLRLPVTAKGTEKGDQHTECGVFRFLISVLLGSLKYVLTTKISSW